MLIARTSGSKRNAWLPRLYEIQRKRKRLVTKALRNSKKKKTLGYQGFKNAGAIFESNGLSFRVETTRKDTELLKCE